ncbi:MAG TPA: tripartite tricarboxylate transporter substrate binding protein [Pseudorhizobium sp.]|nr:tripartite tricarboxylate transporter substrate binding protein [Pseudorhizobium sp.]
MSANGFSARAFLRLVIASASISVATIATASEWKPEKDVEMIISYAPGGGLDLFARKVIDVVRSEKLAPVNINPENRSGGSGAVGWGWVKANRSDSNETLTPINTASILTPLQVNGATGWKDLRPLSNIMAEDYVIFVKGDSPFKTLDDLVKAAKASPQAVSIAVGGIGDTVATRVVGKAIGAEFNLVTFSGGGETTNALLGGNVDATVSNPGEFLGQLTSGSIRALATTRQGRYEGELSSIATMKELGYSNELVQNWRGIAGPKGMSDEAAAYWQSVFAKVSESPAMKEYIAKNSAAFEVHDGAAYAEYIEKQEAVFKELMK